VATAYLAPTRISKHLSRTPDGFLLCKDSPFTRSGWFTYSASELGLSGSGNVEVWRSPEEITSPRFLASAEAAPLCDHHPGRFVDPSNYRLYAVGHIQNVRVSPEKDSDGNVQVIADLFINDGDLADRVEAGVIRDLSPGFDYQLEEDSKGRLCQVSLRCNHCAVVPAGRSGTSQIVDAASRASFGEIADSYLNKNPMEVAHATDSRKETMETEQEDLIPVPEQEHEVDPSALRSKALDWLRSVKPAAMKGSDTLKRLWNDLFSAIRGGEEPRAALDRLTRAHGTLRAADGADRSDLASLAADFLGRDISEVAAEREERTPLRTALDASPEHRRAVAEDLMARAAQMGRKMRAQRY
jgi:uncharacterized protein DUF2213